MKDISTATLEKELNETKKVLDEQKSKQRRITYEKGKLSREKAQKRFEEIKPKLLQYLKSSLKKDDIIECKAYRGCKQVVSITDYSVLAMCGRFWKGEFIMSGYGSETSLENVTAILKNSKFVKIKDLI